MKSVRSVTAIIALLLCVFMVSCSLPKTPWGNALLLRGFLQPGAEVLDDRF